jgi:DNA-directed RNA polymerase specialized sigma subunit
MSDLPDPALRDPAEEMDERDRRTALRHAVAKLAPGDQLLIRLRFEQGLTAREIAPLLGLPTQFHVYRRLETICGIVRDQLSGGAPSANLRPAGSRRKCAR